MHWNLIFSVSMQFILCAFAYLSDWMAFSGKSVCIPQKMSLNILGGKFWGWNFLKKFGSEPRQLLNNFLNFSDFEPRLLIKCLLTKKNQCTFQIISELRIKNASKIHQDRKLWNVTISISPGLLEKKEGRKWTWIDIIIRRRGRQ